MLKNLISSNWKLVQGSWMFVIVSCTSYFLVPESCSESNAAVFGRVRAILALGYWVLGNICRYWVVLLLGDIFFSLWHPIRYRSDRSQHHPQDNHLDICGVAVVTRRRKGEWGGGRVQAIHHHHHHHHTVLRFYVVLYIFCFNINTLLYDTVVLVFTVGYWYH